MIVLSDNTEQRLQRVFKPSRLDEARAILVEHCADNLPFYQQTSPAELERIRYAVLKLSGGRIDKLQHWVHEAQIDWRDVLVAAGFGTDVTAHERWEP